MKNFYLKPTIPTLMLFYDAEAKLEIHSLNNLPKD